MATAAGASSTSMEGANEPLQCWETTQAPSSRRGDAPQARRPGEALAGAR